MIRCDSTDCCVGPLRTMARRLGDGHRCGEAEASRLISSGEPRSLAKCLMELLGENDVNVRIGACRLVRRATPALALLSSEDRHELRKALKRASQDRSCNDYPYGDQTSELEVVTVAEEAEAALSDLDLCR